MAADAERSHPAQPGRGGAEMPIHPLVTKILGEAGEPQNLVAMVGYIGPSKKEGHVRLYTGLDFQTYYEIPRERVVLAEAVDREDENSPTRVMIGADATVELVQTSRQTGPASYLAGARVSAPLRRMAAVAARVDAGDLAPRMEVPPRPPRPPRPFRPRRSGGNAPPGAGVAIRLLRVHRQFASCGWSGNSPAALPSGSPPPRAPTVTPHGSA